MKNNNICKREGVDNLKNNKIKMLVFSIVLSMLLAMPTICSADYNPAVKVVEWGFRGDYIYCVVENTSNRNYENVFVSGDIFFSNGAGAASVDFANIITPGFPLFSARSRITLLTPFPRIPNRDSINKMITTGTEAY